MLGEKIGETKGKVTNQRVIDCEASGIKVEVSFQTTGKLLGFEINEIGTYSSKMREGGALYGEGQGVMMTKDGDSITWRGSGVGKPTGRGMGVSYRGAIYYESNSPKFSRLNSLCGVFDYEVDENGNTQAVISEWK
jgi:hypothetical protein